MQAIDPDNTDGYQADAPGTGFATTAAETLDFLSFLSVEARAQGMAIGLKNTLGLIAGNVQLWDFAVNEQCYNYNECDYYTPFQAGAHLTPHSDCAFGSPPGRTVVPSDSVILAQHPAANAVQHMHQAKNRPRQPLAARVPLTACNTS